MNSAAPIEPCGPDQVSLTLDDAGFSTLYRTTAQDLVVFFARRTYDPEAAADLMAETFAKAYLSRRRFRGSTEEAARAWLFGIARRRFAMYVRRGKAERRALRRLGLERPQLVDGEYARIEELAGLDAMRATLSEHLSMLARRNARRSSCGCCGSFPIRMSPSGSASASKQPERACPGRSERWDRLLTAWQQSRGDENA